MKKINAIIFSGLLGLASMSPLEVISVNAAASEKVNLDDYTKKGLGKMIYFYKRGHKALVLEILEEIMQERTSSLEEKIEKDSEEPSDDVLYDKLKQAYESVNFNPEKDKDAIKNILIMSFILEQNLQDNLVEDLMKDNFTKYDNYIRKNPNFSPFSPFIGNNYLMFSIYQMEKEANRDHNSALKKFEEIIKKKTEENNDNNPYLDNYRSAYLGSYNFYKNVFAEVDKIIAEVKRKGLHLSEKIIKDFNLRGK